MNIFKRATPYIIRSKNKVFEGQYLETVTRMLHQRGKPQGPEDLHKFQVSQTGLTNVLSVFESDIKSGLFTIEETKKC